MPRSVAADRLPAVSRRLALRPTAAATIPILGESMLDIIMLAIGAGFFVLAVGYTIACDHF